MLDLNDIALFVHVVRCGSFAEAARRLGLPANTVSRRVQQLEARLATRLLQRSTRRLTLTSAGEAFHGQCAGAVDGLLEAGQALAIGQQEPSGLVRVAMPADFFDFFPVEWVAEFLAAYPRVRLDFILSDARADLIADRIDVAFRGGEVGNLGYVGRQLLPVRGDGLMASPAYLAAHGAPATLDELSRHSCVIAGHPGGRTLWRLTGPDGSSHEVSVTGRFSANTAQALRKAAVAGLGIALLPSSVARLDALARVLVPVLPGYQRKGLGLTVLYPSRRNLPPAVSAFISLVADKLGEIDVLQNTAS
ncbi:LysR family transcriptional regulator [Acidovorax sp. SUPP3334]|uniref:LysR family transcriptional regulator n=1 Tax=Acidovorax sp. SUPP3334 TaxID=2920881 RepID=UPI0023DE44AA|nr:LysR family transcriptional regulator [Acidovorax sp. SUPP3334]GKT22447.1 LysR family transcriptional regulator [Acidovorax sp. SUPP3334]